MKKVLDTSSGKLFFPDLFLWIILPCQFEKLFLDKQQICSEKAVSIALYFANLNKPVPGLNTRPKSSNFGGLKAISCQVKGGLIYFSSTPYVFQGPVVIFKLLEVN